MKYIFGAIVSKKNQIKVICRKKLSMDIHWRSISSTSNVLTVLEGQEKSCHCFAKQWQ